MHVVAPCAQGQDVPPLPRIAIDEPISEALPPIDAPAPAAVRSCGPVGWRRRRSRARRAAWRFMPPARCRCGWRSTAPVTVDGVEPWRAALQGLLTRHREGIAILEIEAGADAEARHVCDQTGRNRSAVRARVDTGRAQWLAAVVSRVRSPISTRRSSRRTSISWCCRRRPGRPPHPPTF